MAKKSTPKKFVWQFRYKKFKSLSENIENFLALISVKNKVRFITDTPFEVMDIETATSKQYNITEIYVIGDVRYVNEKMKGSFNSLKKYIYTYTNSEESLDDKIYELSEIKILLLTFLYRNSLHEPFFLEMDSAFEIFTQNWEKCIVARWGQCLLSPNLEQELVYHIDLRNKYVKLLYDLCALHLDKQHLIETRKRMSEYPEDYEMERKLLQVWVAMDLCGLMDNFNKDQKNKHRKEFFNLFNLTDKEFSHRNTNLRKIKNVLKTDVVKKMALKMETYF